MTKNENLKIKGSATISDEPDSYLRDGASVSDPVLSDGSASYTPSISQSGLMLLGHR